MTCYMGLHTKTNKVRWGIFGACAFIALVLFVTWANANENCRGFLDKTDRFDEDCDGVSALSRDCKNLGSSCAKSFNRLVAFIFFAVAASLPLYTMCCCSSPPVHKYGLQFEGPNAVGLAIAPPPGVPMDSSPCFGSREAAAAKYAADSSV